MLRLKPLNQLDNTKSHHKHLMRLDVLSCNLKLLNRYLYK